MKDYLKKYMHIIRQKDECWKETRPEGNNSGLYLKGLLDEVKEVSAEIQKDNHVFLEDELGDVLWDFLNILHYLEKDGYITSHEAVFRRSFEKYQERVQDQLQGIKRKETKARQKDRLQDEHKRLYGSRIE